MFILYNNETEKFETFTRTELLEMINRDRSNEFSPYDGDSSLRQIAEIVNTMCEPYSIEEDMPYKTGG